jgi:3',5'-cyclic AMP phosphodiesterase CpdA
MKPLKIAQVSDFHLTRVTWNPFRLLSKRLVGTVNWLISRKGNFSRKPIDALGEAVRGAEFVLLGGDFTTTALPSEYALAAEFVKGLPAPWIAIPGNHDHYTSKAYWQKRFYRYLANRAGLFEMREDGVEGHELRDGWWVVAMDTARPTWGASARGFFSPKVEKRLVELLGKIPRDASILLFNHYPFFQNDIDSHNLVRGEALQAIVRKDERIRLYLHGHTHRNIIADLQENGLPVILDSGCSADAKRGTWQLLTIDDMGIVVDVYRWENGWVHGRKESIAWKRGSPTV